MSSPLRVFRRQSLRFRITAAFVLTAALLATTLSTITYYAVRNFLEDQRVRSSTRQTVFGLVFARDMSSDSDDTPQELVSLLQSRGRFEAMVTTPGNWFSTTLSLTPRAVPAELRALVEQERLAYQVAELGGSRMLAFGAPLPAVGNDVYFFYSLDDIDETMSLLARVLIVGGFAVVAIAIAAAQRLSRRVLHPLDVMGTAARHVAEGLLETRLEEAERRDEVGRLAASFNQMAAALQEMIERERRFVAGVSHELRTPLAALHATSEVLLEQRAALGPSGREAVELMAEDVANLRRLVEELMEVSELDAGRAPVRSEELELRALASAVVAKRRVDVPVDGPEVPVVTDKARVERILSNLLDNALDHGLARDVRIGVSREGDAAVITVSDAGPGIPPADLPHLFDRFYKSDRSRTREHGGIGLGLAIAAENARLLGGTIDVVSASGEGATFTVRLPQRETAR